MFHLWETELHCDVGKFIRFVPFQKLRFKTNLQASKIVYDVWTPPKYTRPFWREASDDFGGPMFLGYPSNLSLENQTVKPFSKKIGISEAFMARNVKERGFLVDHLMDLIQRWARIPKENLDPKLCQVGEKKRGSRWKHFDMNCWNWVGTLYLYIPYIKILLHVYAMYPLWKHDWLLFPWSYTASKWGPLVNYRSSTCRCENASALGGAKNNEEIRRFQMRVKQKAMKGSTFDDFLRVNNQESLKMLGHSQISTYTFFVC